MRKVTHIINLVITRKTDSVLLGSPMIGHFISDHPVLNCSLNSIKPSLSKKLISYRKIKDIDITALKENLISARKLTIAKQHEVSTSSCHNCQMNKLEITENAYL